MKGIASPDFGLFESMPSCGSDTTVNELGVDDS